jgi:hypothetical protein
VFLTAGPKTADFERALSDFLGFLTLSAWPTVPSLCS